MKICTKCKIELNNDLFNKNKSKKDGLNNICKICSKERSRKYYNDNRQNHIYNISIRNERLRNRNRKLIVDYLSSKSCIDCGNLDSRVLEFDHLPEFKKFKDVSYLIAGGYSEEIIRKEIDKCEVVCCNCHRVRTINRSKNNYRKLL